MPWKIASLLRVRQRFVESALTRQKPLKELCRTFGISRPTGYKWLTRYRVQGRAGLADRSRKPIHSPRRLARRWCQAISHWRRRRPHWGAKKIHARLRGQYPRARLPSIRTIHRCLRRLGRVPGRPRQRARRGPAVLQGGLTGAVRPNHVWTVDFKGWFRTADGQRQDPLTVRDLFSRYALQLQLLSNQDDAGVRRCFQRLFCQRGLPAIIRVDNGSPFAGKGALGLSRLSVWWLRLGIQVEFTRRARPGDNAAHEQFHGCYQREVVARTAPNRRVLQRRSQRWLDDYNQHRPHEHLGQQTPARHYQPSRRTLPAELAPLRYPVRWEVRRVRSTGRIRWRGRLRFIGRAFVGQMVGLQPLPSAADAVWLGDLLIGELHERDAGGLRPARWQRLNSQLKV